MPPWLILWPSNAAEEDGQNSYELERESNIGRNTKRLRELGVEQSSEMENLGNGKQQLKKRKLAQQKSAKAPTTPTRRSTRERKAATSGPVATESAFRGSDEAAGRRAALRAKKESLASGRALKNSGAGPPPMGADAPFGGQRYTKLTSAAPEGLLPRLEPSEGKRNCKGQLVFPDAPEFTPNLTPAEMIRAGVFGGCYFNPKGGKAGIFGRTVAISHEEFPQKWFGGLPVHMYTNRRYDISLNRYKVKAGQDQAFWESKGW
eukprot:CAMPEP_0117689186 /NCGR_PEP_ID=MMETSP0804-20121206/24323_1 /TAXON_ID=1074897 /ORGANISM="Tetraselmis astigmatica, Strain CCMP880" /LENGTH=261 /DNA_ID=CAMNT_0005501877 /DNA_START=115 /DNA_END=898 /DNA_ORIENTATION=+